MSKKLKASGLTYRSLLITYLRPQWKRAALIIVFLLSGTALQLINPQLLRYFIDAATNGQANTQMLFIVGGLFIALALVTQAVSVLTTYLSENVAWSATSCAPTWSRTVCAWNWPFTKGARRAS